MDNPLRVLLIGNCPEEIRRITNMLVREGTTPDIPRFHLEQVERLSPAGPRLAAGDIDVVLLDLEMPDNQGLDALHQVRAQAPHLPVVVLNGPAAEDRARESIQAGAQDYLVKGRFDRDRLVQALLYAIERQRAQKHLDISEVGRPAVLKNTAGHWQSEEAIRRQAETLAALHETALDLSAQRALPDLLQAIVARAARLVHGRGGGIYLYRPASDDLEYVATYQVWRDRLGIVLKRGEGLAGKVLESGRPMTVEHYAQWEGRSPQYADADFACLAMPIRWGDRMLGVFDVEDDPPRVFSAEDIALLERFTPLAAAALENARLLQAERTRRQIAETLRQASIALSSTLNLEQVLELILDQLRQVIPYDSASIQRLSDGSLEIVACRGFSNPQEVIGLRFPLEPKFPNRRVMETRAPLVFEDVTQEYPVFQEEGKTYSSAHIRSWLGVPLLAGEQAIGMIALDRTAGQPFSDEEVDLALAFAGQAAMALENARLYRDLQQQMEQLKEAQAQLVRSAKLAAVGELAAGVAHELNNPLTSILGFSELLLNETSLAEPYRQDLEIIAAEARRARDIVRNLLNFARPMPPQRQPADINLILQQTLGLMRGHLETTGVEISESYAPDVGSIFVDISQIKQVLLNLITNAIQSMPEGGRLSVRTERVGEEVAVSVADTGEGIPPEVRERIFEPFFTTKRTGTGLGLSISSRIAQEHGGRITVESRPGYGSTFTVWLPGT